MDIILPHVKGGFFIKYLVGVLNLVEILWLNPKQYIRQRIDQVMHKNGHKNAATFDSDPTQ